MRMVPLFVVCALLLAAGVSCTRETTFTLCSSDENRNVIVAVDKETMRKVIEVSVKRTYGDSSLIDLFSGQKVFLVQAGTKVEVEDPNLFGRTVRIHILEGEQSGRDGWVHKSMLCKTTRAG